MFLYPVSAKKVRSWNRESNEIKSWIVIHLIGSLEHLGIISVEKNIRIIHLIKSPEHYKKKSILSTDFIDEFEFIGKFSITYGYYLQTTLPTDITHKYESVGKFSNTY